MRILIVGGSGTLGAALVRRRRPEHQLLLLHHQNPVEGSKAFNLEAEWSIPVRGVDVAIVAVPTARLLMAAGQHENPEPMRHLFRSIGTARPVLLSTDAVFCGNRGGYGEAAPTDATTPYGRTQALLDGVFLATCPDGLVVRTSFLFGGRAPRYDKRLQPFLDGKSNPADQRWPDNVFRSPTEVDFCAEGIWRSLERGLAGVINICGERMSIHAFFGRALRRPGDAAFPPPVPEMRTDIARDTSLDPALMEAKLDLDRRLGWTWYEENQMMGRATAHA